MTNPVKLTEGMRERVARALAKIDGVEWENAAPMFKGRYRARAQTVLASLGLGEDGLTDAQLDAGADAYHEACAAAIAERKARNDQHEAAGRGRLAPEIAFPNDWLEPVFRAMLEARPDA